MGTDSSQCPPSCTLCSKGQEQRIRTCIDCETFLSCEKALDKWRSSPNGAVRFDALRKMFENCQERKPCQ